MNFIYDLNMIYMLYKSHIYVSTCNTRRDIIKESTFMNLKKRRCKIFEKFHNPLRKFSKLISS